MKKIELLLLALIIGLCSAYAQENYYKYLEATRNHIKSGNYDMAKITYGIYKEMTKKTDSNIEKILYPNTAFDKKTEVKTFTFSNGDKYVGDYMDGKRTGKGTYYWSNGDKYVGDFVDGKMTNGTFSRYIKR